MNRDSIRQISVSIAVVATIVFNILANIIPYNGLTTGEISDRFDVLFVPAGYVFSIWGVIYLFLIAYGVFQFLPGQRENSRLRRIGWLFILSCIANVAWLFLWHYEQFLATAPVMLALLGLLIAINLKLGTGGTGVSRLETWAVRLTFSIYLGWISVATIANLSDVLFYLNWNGFSLSAEIWYTVMLAAVWVITTLMLFRRGDYAYSLVILWALAGIAIKQAELPYVAYAAWATFALVSLTMLSRFGRKGLEPARAQVFEG